MTAITQADQWTPVLQKQEGDGYSFSISGSFTGTIVVQRSKTQNGPWYDIYTTTTSAEIDGDVATMYYLRAGVKSGASFTGTAVVDGY